MDDPDADPEVLPVPDAFAGVVDCGPSCGGVSFTCKLAPFALLVFPSVDAASLGLNASPAQPPTWKRLETAALAPSSVERAGARAALPGGVAGR